MADNSRFGAIIIGDEILSGKRQDKHLPNLIEQLDKRGLELAWVRLVGDDADLLRQTLRETFAGSLPAFSFGGIGATPDDRTRQCAAEAAGVELAFHEEGLAELDAQFGAEITPQRRRLVEFPVGAELIPNPVNRVPGFSFRHHHFVPGFPSMAWPMIEWVLDQKYARHHAPGRRVERMITLFDARESQIIPLMEDFVARYPALRMSCLPHADASRFQLELGLRGEPRLVAEALAALTEAVEQLGFRWQLVEA